MFLNVNAAGTKLAKADFAGLQWRHGSLAGSDLSDADLCGCQWIDVELTAAVLPEDPACDRCTVELARPMPSAPVPSYNCPTVTLAWCGPVSGARTGRDWPSGRLTGR